MKRFCAFVITAIFVLGLIVSPVIAGGGKIQGDNSAQGDVQGDLGNTVPHEDGAPGDDAMGRQV